MRSAGHQIWFLAPAYAGGRQLAQGEAHYQEAFVIQTLFGLAQIGAGVQAEDAGAVGPLPAVLEAVRAHAVLSEVSVPAPAEAVEALEASLLEGEVSPSALARLWGGVTGTRMLMLVLYFRGLSLEVIGSFFGVDKTTVMRWLAPFAHLNWQEVVGQGKRFFSGILAVDEKWIKIDGVWWYLFVAVDHVSGFPLHVALFPSNSRDYCQAFLLQVKALGYTPKTIITDGWDAYVEAIAWVFPNAQHLLCRFHALKSAPAYAGAEAVYQGLEGASHVGRKAQRSVSHPLQTDGQKAHRKAASRSSRHACRRGHRAAFCQTAQALTGCGLNL